MFVASVILFKRSTAKPLLINFNMYSIKEAFIKYKNSSLLLQVTGENPPRAIESFETANLRNYVLNNILKSGYKKPTPIQKHAIPIIMNGRDLMGCAQTGSGKTVSVSFMIILKISYGIIIRLLIIILYLTRRRFFFLL